MMGDSANRGRYGQLMDEHRPFMTLTIDCKDPIEVYDFVDLFIGLSEQYEDYVKKQYPKAPQEARIYVKRVRGGSVVADLFPGGPGDMLAYMDSFLIITGFATTVGAVIKKYAGKGRVEGVKKKELEGYYKTVSAVANDPNGFAQIESAYYEEGVLNKKVEFKFTTSEAKEAARNIQSHIKEIESPNDVDFERVVMSFARVDKSDADVGKRSGERVIIEDISPKEKPLIYGSQLAEDRIKHEIRQPESVFYKWFVVDVNVVYRGKAKTTPAAYRVMNVHQVIDTPSDDDN